MINRKSKKQKEIENERTPEAFKTQLEDLFAREFHLSFDFNTDIQAIRWPAIKIKKKLSNAGYVCEDTVLEDPVTFNNINYAPASFIKVVSPMGTGKLFDLYIIEERYRNAMFVQSWVVKDYPQDRDFYHRYDRERRLASARRFKCDK